MLGANRKHHAKSSLPLPVPTPTFCKSSPWEAPPKINTSSPPAYALPYRCHPTITQQWQQTPPPIQTLTPDQPTVSTKQKTRSPIVFARAKPRKTISKTPLSKSPPEVGQPIARRSSPPQQWQEGPDDHLADGDLCELVATKLDAVLTSIDGEDFTGDSKELEIQDNRPSGIRGGWGLSSREVSRGANRAISTAVTSTNYFSKVNFYANSKLPPNLPPLKLYFPSYPLLCLAAQYSQRAYTRPTSKERETFVEADWRVGTKAMVIKSVPIDDMNCVVFAIRGSQTFMDWAVNLKSAPVTPTDFLDDPGNLCHSGFLSVARKMIKPVAARLRSLLEEDPSRSTCSLLLTGHSAGGAVASLLYAHMLAEVAKSELNVLTGCFKRIHCLTFGTPPLSLLPLTKPPTFRHKKSLFMSFINEGDPVPRADKAYIRSLLNLYASPAPGTRCLASTALLKPTKDQRPQLTKSKSAPMKPAPAYTWRVPPGTLSNAGRLVVLRDNQNAGTEPTNDVKAEITSDEELRSVIFGDPVMHMMTLYAKRVEVLATKAVTAKIWG